MNNINIIDVLKNIAPKYVLKKVKFLLKYGFMPPPSYTDLSGYEKILDFIIENKVYELEGDIVEIGVFLGGGTYKLCRFFEKCSPNKKVFALDNFAADLDNTICNAGIKMSELYSTHLKLFKIKSQLDTFRLVTKHCKNLELPIGDSKEIILPTSAICFAYIDGNHSSEYIVNDFNKVWEKLVHGGIVAFDDYGYDLPNVTKTINEIVGKESKVIKRVYTVDLKTIFIVKNSGSV